MERTKEPEIEKNPWGLPDIGIPAEVLFHPKLTHTEKMMYGFLRNLSKSEKGCWASNKWLGGCLGIKGQTVSIIISNLKRYELIIVEYFQLVDGRESRRIFINLDYPKIYEQMLTEEGYEFSDKEIINKGVLLKSYPLLLKSMTPIIKINDPYYKNHTKIDIKKDIEKDNKNLRGISSLKDIKEQKITPSMFEKFWKLYPKRIDKGKTKTAWEKKCNPSNKDRPTWKEIKLAIIKQKKSERWQDAKFIPHSTTWLNQQRWLDDPAEMKSYSKESPTNEISSRIQIQNYFDNNVLIKAFQTKCLTPAADLFSNISKSEITNALLKLHDQIDKKQNKNLSANIRALLPSPFDLLIGYINWITKNDWITNLTINMIDVSHSLFLKYCREAAIADNLERDPITGKSYMRE